MTNIELKLLVNGEQVSVSCAPYARLLDVLRDHLGLTGTKEGCGIGECGACTVLLDGLPVDSCLMLGASCEGKSIETIEGLGYETDLHPVQEAFVKHNALQCGFCIPGLVMSAKALLERYPEADRKRIQEAISGNLCRCTGYKQVVEAIESARDTMQDPNKEAKSPETGMDGPKED